jgi:hypothetical protein
LSQGEFTTLSNSGTPNYGQTFNQAFGSVLEVGVSPAPPVTQCSDYPSNGSITFNGALYDNTFDPIELPNWSLDILTGASPQRDYGGQVLYDDEGNQVVGLTIDY